MISPLPVSSPAPSFLLRTCASLFRLAMPLSVFSLLPPSSLWLPFSTVCRFIPLSHSSFRCSFFIVPFPIHWSFPIPFFFMLYLLYCFLCQTYIFHVSNMTIEVSTNSYFLYYVKRRQHMKNDRKLHLFVALYNVHIINVKMLFYIIDTL